MDFIDEESKYKDKKNEDDDDFYSPLLLNQTSHLVEDLGEEGRISFL